MKNKLQVKINGQWEFVFCRNERKIDPVITDDIKKAVSADALEYFKKHFSHEFRVFSKGDL